MKFYKYHGAGNDFLIADGRGSDICLDETQISSVCQRHTGIGADGVMILEDSEDYDFRMQYFNSDGSGGMMCGNGGRCIVAFAADLGYTHFHFQAPDGEHYAEIISDGQTAQENSFCRRPRTVRLKMKDVCGPAFFGNDIFLDTGTRHLVHFVDDIENCEVFAEGRRLRYDPRFAPVGVNVNFVRIKSNDEIIVRTYEKGVENETLACGTGIVASALASYIAGYCKVSDDGKAVVHVRSRISDLTVEFTLSADENTTVFKNIWLTGPAEFIGTVSVEI